MLLQEMIGNTSALQAFIKKPDSTECMEANVPKHDDSWELNIFHKELYLNSATALQGMPRGQRDEHLARMKDKGLSIRPIERLTGINRGVIQKAGNVVKKNFPL